MATDFSRARKKLIALYLLIIAAIIGVFSILIIYQTGDSFSDPAVPTDAEVELSVEEAKKIAQAIFLGQAIEGGEYEIEYGKLLYTVSFADDNEVKINLLTGEVKVPEEEQSIVGRITDDFEEMVGWIALIVFLLSGLLSVFVANRTLVPIAEGVRMQKQFISDAAHEFRNPLTALHARIESALRLGKEHLKTTVFEDLLKETRHLIALSEKLLALEKVGHLEQKTETVDAGNVAMLVAERLSHYAKDKGVQFKTDIAASSLIIDRADLETLLYNLVHNAIKFTASGGEVVLDFKGRVLTVSDTGIGMSDEDRLHMFERFYKADKARNNEGNGLGLSLVKEIVDRYKATIEVTSELGKGTTIQVTFA